MNNWIGLIMKKTMFFMAGIIFFITSSLTPAAKWELITDSPDGTKLYFDSTSVGPRGSWVKTWFRFEYGGPRETVLTSDGKKEYRSTLELLYFNCKEKTSATAQQIFYSQADMSGSPVQSSVYTIKNESFKDPAPGTLGEAMLAIGCNPRKQSR